LIARILDDLQRLESMISNLLDTARLEEGRVQLRPERVSVAETARAVLEELTERACAAGTFFDNALPADLEAEADAVAVRTVLRNLMDNAIKATGAKGGGTIHLSGRRGNGVVRVEVRDDGVGFAPEEGPRLFEKFYRPGDELRRTSKGSGLGLYIVRRFVQLTGGRIAAHSDGPGKGAAFTVEWPVPRGGGETGA
jgi:signal transduction histidine kinase